MVAWQSVAALTLNNTIDLVFSALSSSEIFLPADWDGDVRVGAEVATLSKVALDKEDLCGRLINLILRSL